LAETSSIIKKLNGKSFYYGFLAGAHKIFEHQEYLNKINVFPVPDADTGTNLASTMRSIVDTRIPTGNIRQTATAIADAAIVGARGNSGIIFAQFLFGFGNEIKHDGEIDVANFAEILKKAVIYAYEAMTNPVEGTMITVIREWAEFIDKFKDKTDNFISLFSESYIRANQSLEETQQKLEVLKKNKVVDAGAKGFVVFLEGLLDFLKTGKLRELISSWKITKAADITFITHDKITFRFCTEALIDGNNLKTKTIRKKIDHLGDSVVVGGSEQKVRVHIHTDLPSQVFSILTKYGNIIYQKVDDMVFQKEIAENRKWKIGLLTDSTCDLPKDLMDKYQIHPVPINLYADGNQYLDRVTISPDEFYKLLDTAKIYPTTSQPGTGDFINKFDYLASHYESVLAVMVSKELSGTWSNCSKAAEKVLKNTDIPISVHDSRTVSAGLGLLVWRVAKAIDDGLPYEEIQEKIKDWRTKTRVLVSPQTLKYFVKGGRVSPMKGLIAKILNLKPIITITEEGKAITFDKSFSRKGSIKKVLRIVEKISSKNRIWNYAVVYSNKEERKTAEWYAEKLEKITRKKVAYIDPISPVVGVNAGIGTIAVTLMLE